MKWKEKRKIQNLWNVALPLAPDLIQCMSQNMGKKETACILSRIFNHKRGLSTKTAKFDLSSNYYITNQIITIIYDYYY